MAGRYDDAIAACRDAAFQPGRYGAGNAHLYRELAQAGRMDEARALLARMKETHPALSIAWIEQNVPYTPGPMAKFLEGMHKAGLE